MYLQHYGLAEAPFRITPHTDFFFSGANRGTTLEALVYAITNDEGIVKVSGEVGSGKTMLCRVLMERLPENVVTIYLANPSLGRDDIIFALADELGTSIPEHGRASAMLRALQEKLVALYAAGKQVVVLIDEAHAMPKETLEEIRLLSNLESSRHKLLQLVLFGQPEINETLMRPDMRQLRERITHNFCLEPMVRDDIAMYLDFRMRAAGYHGPNVFAPAAIKMIADTSRGLTRRVNILADKALLASFAAGGHQVGPREVKAAIKDSEFAATYARKTGMRPPPAWLWAGTGALAMLAIIGLWRLAGGTATETLPVDTLKPPLLVAPSLPAPPSVGAPAEPVFPVTSQVETNPLAAAPLPVSQPEPVVAPRGDAPSSPLEAQLVESRRWLDSVEKNRWFIQLYTVAGDQPEQVEALLAKARSAGVVLAQLRVYHSDLSGVARYGVIYGDYVSRKEAQNALGDLPASLKTNRPYPRQFIRLR